MILSKFLKKFEKYNINYSLIILFLLILFIGFIVLLSSSVIIADKKFDDKYYFVFKQLIMGILPSIFLFFFTAFLIDYKLLKKFNFILFVFNVLLLVAVLIPGIGQMHGGARSWIDIGPIAFQPAEIMKFSLIVFLASFFEKNKSDVKDFKNGFIPFIVILGIISLLLLAQPDLGGLSIVYIIANFIYFIAGASKRHLLIIMAGSILALFLFLQIDKNLTGGIRTTRIRMLFAPEEFSNRDEGYHVNQAMIAVGTGGIFGRGIGKSVQKFSYLPEVIADSIFAVMAEEFGFILTTLIIGVYVLMLYKFLGIAKGAPDDFSKLFVVGVTAWIGFQVFVNIGAMIRLYPLTGVPLPFISYGSTSMWMLAIACGFVVNISKFSKVEDDFGFINKPKERKSKVIINKE